MWKEHRIFGPPGCGKTYDLTNFRIPELADQYGADRLMITSFTRVGARNIAARAARVINSRLTEEELGLDPRLIGTLHAICYHGLGMPALVLDKLNDWNAAYPHYPIRGKKVNTLDEGGDTLPNGGSGNGDHLLAQVNRLRAQLIDSSRWPEAVGKFAKQWEDFKEQTRTVDFTDLIAMARENLPEAPGRPMGIIGDEVQDFTPQQLDLLRSWLLTAKKLVLAGDDDQCLPTGELIRTPTGDRPIESLQPGDLVLSHGGARGIITARVAIVSSRPVDAPLLRITTRNGASVRCTLRHHIPMRMKRMPSHQDAHQIAIHMLDPNRSPNPQSEPVGIHLKVPHLLQDTGAPNLREARAYTRILGERFDIPVDELWWFEPSAPYRMANAEAVTPNSWLMTVEGPDPAYTIGGEIYTGTVHDIEVEGTHNFITTSGLVVGNCLYTFQGATADAFLKPDLPPEQKTFLEQSYRVPRAVHALAEEIAGRIKLREAKRYRPRHKPFPDDDEVAEGRLIRSDDNFYCPENMVADAVEKVSAGESALIMTSCAYMLDAVRRELKNAGMPFANPFRKNPAWNPLAGTGNGISTAKLVADFMGKGPDDDWWTVEQFVNFAGFLKVGPDSIVRNVGKKRFKLLKQALEHGAPGLHTVRDVAGHVLTKNGLERALARDLEWLRDHLTKTRAAKSAFPIRIVEQRGTSALTDPPKLWIGTIHSYKGEQADHVYLFPDISYAAREEAAERPHGEDDLHRLFYVGVTRAFKTLTVGDAASDLFVEL